MLVRFFFSLLVFTLTSTAFAKEYQLKCTAKHNLDLIFDTEVTLKDTDKNKLLGTYEGFDFILSSLGQDILELQVFNGYEPSRIYSTSKFSKSGDFVEQSVWKRDYLLDVRCTHL